MENVTLKGVLEYHARGIGNEQEWRPRYYVLHGPTDTQEARLDWYDGERSYLTEPTTRKSMYMQQIADVGICTSSGGKPHTFEVQHREGEQRHLYAARSKEEMKEWIDHLLALVKAPTTPVIFDRSDSVMSTGSVPDMLFDDNAIYEPSEQGLCYIVQVAATDVSKRLHLEGEYKLMVNSLNLSLTCLNGTSPLYVWPYRYIRRYGRSRSTFTFEAGRKCHTGEGLFTFKVGDGNALFQAVQERTKAMKAQEPPADFRMATLPAQLPSAARPKSPPESYVTFKDHGPPSSIQLPSKVASLPGSPRVPAKVASLPSSPQVQGPTKVASLPRDGPCSLSVPLPVARRDKSHSPKARRRTPPPPAEPTEPLYDEPDAHEAPPAPTTRRSISLETEVPAYSKPFDEEDDTYSRIDPEYHEYTEPESPQAKAKTMSQLVAQMNKSRLEGGNEPQPRSDSYDHIDFHKAPIRPTSEELQEDMHPYGDLTLGPAPPDTYELSKGWVGAKAKPKPDLNGDYYEIDSFRK